MRHRLPGVPPLLSLGRRLLLALVGLPLVLAAGGCGGEDGAEGGGEPDSVSLEAVQAGQPRTVEVPEALVRHLGPDTIRGHRVDGGVSYTYLWSAKGPWALHLLGVDLGRCELDLEVLRAEGPEGGPARRTVTELLEAVTEGALAAVNADFFTPEGVPLGFEVADGRARLRSPRPAFAWRPGQAPWVGDPTPGPDSVIDVGWPLSLREPDPEAELVAGFPALLADGARVDDLSVSERPGFAASRHPRTAVAWDREPDVLWIVVVDGRRPGYSEGMTLPELATVLEALGVEEALNLDGGGSSVMVVEGRAVSRPSDEEGERPVANALAVVRDSTACRARAPR